MPNLKSTLKTPESAAHICYILNANAKGSISKELKKYKNYLRTKMKSEKHQLLRFVESDVHIVVLLIVKETKKSHSAYIDSLRKLGVQLLQKFNNEKAVDVYLTNPDEGMSEPEYLSILEGMILGSYQFDKYKSKKEVETVKNIHITGNNRPKSASLKELSAVCQATMTARDLVNEPVITLNAPQLGREIVKLGKKTGFTTKIYNKADIVRMKMGGLLGVNQGSIDPPIFAVMEWKPPKSKNKNPYILVGKGVVYDTGGNNIKIGTYMPTMKSDMGGAAAVIGTMMAVSSAKLPIHVIGLVPSTDNRIGLNALVPDDIITMHDGTTVEVLNTDAEGRLILGDALSFAKKYKPELVIDLATLTGAAAAITGSFGSAFMGTAHDDVKNQLKESGDLVYERLAEMPFWDEYEDLLKSNVADLKNIGGPTGGAMTAGKFLQHFTDYPWIHIDIAGPAFIDKTMGYRKAGGTGVGVRLLFHFLKSKSVK
ncbi:MAG: leucyl aminopeptidase [Vicingaceae bacterium]